ncbi:MAG: OsmC family protein [Actinomycetota bacterium]
MGTEGAATTSNARYRVSARVAAPGVAIGSVKDREIEFDVGRQSGDELPGPAELLALSLGACILKNVERFSHLLSFRYAGAEVTVEAERQDDPPRFTKLTYELRIRTDESPHRVELLHRNLRRFGTVYNTLAGSCAVDGTIIAGPDETVAFERGAPTALSGNHCC